MNAMIYFCTQNELKCYENSVNEEIPVNKYKKDQAYDKVGENDVHSIRELKLWVRLRSAFRFTVVRTSLSILLIAEISE